MCNARVQNKLIYRIKNSLYVYINSFFCIYLCDVSLGHNSRRNDNVTA